MVEKDPDRLTPEKIELSKKLLHTLKEASGERWILDRRKISTLRNAINFEALKTINTAVEQSNNLETPATPNDEKIHNLPAKRDSRTGSGELPAIQYSEKTKTILDQLFPGEKDPDRKSKGYPNDNRLEKIILICLLECQSGQFLTAQDIHKKTGYSESTISSAICSPNIKQGLEKLSMKIEYTRGKGWRIVEIQKQ